MIKLQYVQGYLICISNWHDGLALFPRVSVPSGWRSRSWVSEGVYEASLVGLPINFITDLQIFFVVNFEH